MSDFNREQYYDLKDLVVVVAEAISNGAWGLVTVDDPDVIEGIEIDGQLYWKKDEVDAVIREELPDSDSF